VPDHYHMIDYIREGPEALQRTLEANEGPVQELAQVVLERDLERVILTGIGSSYTAPQMAAAVWLAHSRRMVHIVESADFDSLPAHILNDKALVLAVSRSGERGYVVDSLVHADEAGAVGVAITGSADSLLAKHAHRALITAEGPEITFPKTKSVVAITGLLMRVALALGLPEDPLLTRRLAELRGAPAGMTRAIELAEPQLQQHLEAITGHSQVAISGTGANWGVALEAAMKIQEAAFVPAYANSTDGLLNGPVGALNDSWLVITMVGGRDQRLSDQLLRVAHRFGAHSLVLAEDGVILTETPTYTLHIPGHPDPSVSPLLFLPPLQLLAYYWTVSRGMNPDAPASMDAILQAILPPGRNEPELHAK
jgi:glucosamine--fructose-6-phosphate aminotransferase (isomerizing)